MNKYLSILLTETETSLIGRIVFMDESMRKSDNGFSFKAGNGLMIKSFQYPEVNSNAIYLRGSIKERDDSHFIDIPFNETPGELKKRVVNALIEFLENLFNCKIIVRFDTSNPEAIIYNFCEFNGMSQFHTKE